MATHFPAPAPMADAVPAATPTGTANASGPTMKKIMGMVVIVLMLLLVLTALWKMYRDDQQYVYIQSI